MDFAPTSGVSSHIDRGVHGLIQPGRFEPVDRSLSSSSPPLKRGGSGFDRAEHFIASVKALSCFEISLGQKS